MGGMKRQVMYLRLSLKLKSETIYYCLFEIFNIVALFPDTGTGSTFIGLCNYERSETI